MLAVFGGPCVAEQFVAACFKHLGHEILIDIAEIDGKFVCEEFLIYLVFGHGLVPEGHSYHQSRVSYVHLKLVDSAVNVVLISGVPQLIL